MNRIIFPWIFILFCGLDGEMDIFLEGWGWGMGLHRDIGMEWVDRKWKERGFQVRKRGKH